MKRVVFDENGRFDFACLFTMTADGNAAEILEAYTVSVKVRPDGGLDSLRIDDLDVVSKEVQASAIYEKASDEWMGVRHEDGWEPSLRFIAIRDHFLQAIASGFEEIAPVTGSNLSTIFDYACDEGRFYPCGETVPTICSLATREHVLL